MHLVEQFWNHIRNTDGDTIAFSMFLGFTLVFGIGAAIFTIWALVEWLGVLVVMVPFVLALILLIFYGVGHILVKRFDL